MSTTDDVIKRVRQLYKLAGSTTSEHEAATAIAAAEKLMQAHRLEQADLEDKPEAAVAHTEPLASAKRVPTWVGRLCVVLARHYGCAVLNCAGAIRVFGTPSDVILLRVQYENVHRQIVRLAGRNASDKGRSYANAYRIGLVTTVAERLRAAKAEARQGATSQAIVKIDQRTAAAERALNAAHPLTRASGATRVRSDGYAAGRADGHQIAFGGEIKGRPVALLGSGS